MSWAGSAIIIILIILSVISNIVGVLTAGGLSVLMSIVNTIPIISGLNSFIGISTIAVLWIIALVSTVAAVISTLAIKNEISDYRLWNYILLPVIFPMTGPIILIHNIVTAAES